MQGSHSVIKATLYFQDYQSVEVRVRAPLQSFPGKTFILWCGGVLLDRLPTIAGPGLELIIFCKGHWWAEGFTRRGKPLFEVITLLVRSSPYVWIQSQLKVLPPSPPPFPSQSQEEVPPPPMQSLQYTVCINNVQNCRLWIQSSYCRAVA